jgi:hypothetical protein
MSGRGRGGEQRVARWQANLEPAAIGQEVAIDFGYKVIQCRNFPDLLAGRGEILTRPLVPFAMRHGRTLLQASGGSGKTTLLLALMNERRQRSTSRDMPVTSYVTAQAWRSMLEPDPPDKTLAIEALLHCLQDIGHEFNKYRPHLILVDGLNEIPDPLGNLLLDAITDVTLGTPNVGIIVADRVTHRPVSTKFWTFLTLTPVSAGSISRVLGRQVSLDDAPLLDRPFYLELARQSETGEHTARGIQRAALTRAGLSDAEIDRLAEVVLGQYAKYKSRRFSYAELEEQLGQRITEKLLRSRLAFRTDDHARMAHHLVGDYLAAQAISDDPGRWDREHLDYLTFDGASFDALMILLETLPAGRRDEFLRRVHDWNFYASAHLLVECKNSGLAVAPAVELVLLFMLAEKRLERIVASVTSAAAILRAYPGELADRLSQADTWHALAEVVQHESYEVEWFSTWKSIVTRTPGTVAKHEDVDRLTAAEGVIGWSATNLLRRLKIGNARQERVIELTGHPDPIVRWRAVHVLGRHFSSKAEAPMLRCLRSDSYGWVRYGALRSLIEAAAEVGAGYRRRIFGHLVDSADTIVADPTLLREVERDLEIRDPPDDWAQSAGQLVARLLEKSTTVAEQFRWRTVSGRLRVGAAALE